MPFLKSLQGAYQRYFSKHSFQEHALLGGLSGLVFFPIPGIHILLFFTLPRWLILFDRPTALGPFLCRVWLFYFSFFLVSLHWICQALFVEIDVFWWAVPICLLGGPTCLALVPTLLAPWFLSWSYGVKSKWLRLFFLQFGQGDGYALMRLFMVATWVVTHEFFLLDFLPWSVLGNAWVSVPIISQTAALGGVFTLSFLTVFLMGFPYLWFTKENIVGKKIALVLTVFLCLGILGYGIKRLRVPLSRSPISVRLVQPGIPHRTRWHLQEQLDDLHRLMSISKVKSNQVDAIIWPEAILNLSLDEGSSLPQTLGMMLKGRAQFLITGAVRRKGKHIWNSLYVINQSGQVLGHYDKHHLVPFGEYIPGRSWLASTLGIKNLRKVTAGMKDFSWGSGPSVLDIKGLLPFSPMICFEAIFPGQVVPHDGGPAWLLQITEDSWFGRSVGPHQHLQIARMRAIEEGVPVVRVANTGISAVIDPYGRIVAHMPLNAIGAMDVRVPAPLPTPPLARTIYKWIQWIDNRTSISRMMK